MTWIEPIMVLDKYDKLSWQKPTLGEIYTFFEKNQGGPITSYWMLKEIRRNGL